ncbi:MAG TPA: AlpA family phage regulatory protein [Burkholderiaceae bacterium]|nr:AlpA family phage regulatory protein [Burkholderiaceae bacterium]
MATATHNAGEALSRAERRSIIVSRELAAAAHIAEAQVRLDTVIAMTGMGTTTIYKLMREGKFPQPVRRNARCVRWKASAVRAHLAEQGNQPTAS